MLLCQVAQDTVTQSVNWMVSRDVYLTILTAGEPKFSVQAGFVSAQGSVCLVDAHFLLLIPVAFSRVKEKIILSSFYKATNLTMRPSPSQPNTI